MSTLFNPASGHLRTLVAGGNIQISESGQDVLTISAFGAGGASNALPPAGQSRQVLTKNSNLDYDCAWVSAPYRFQSFFAATPSASQVLLAHKFSTDVVFPANFGVTNANELSGSDGLVNATASTTFTISTCSVSSDPTLSGNWTPVGTITFAAGGNTGLLASSGGTSISVRRGDRLNVVASTTDATLAGVIITLVGDR